MKYIISILLNFVFLLNIFGVVYANDEIKVYVNENEVNNSVITDNESSYINLEKLINSLGGSVEFDKENCEVYFNYNDVTFAMKHTNKWKTLVSPEYDKDKETGLLYISVVNNPKNNLVKNIKSGNIKEGTKFRFYIFNDTLYVKNDGSLEMIMSLLDYKYIFENNCVFLEQMNLTKTYFMSFLKQGITSDEINNHIPYEYRANSYFENTDTFVIEYNLKNNSILKVKFSDNDNEELVLSSAEIFTSNREFVERLI